MTRPTSSYMPASQEDIAAFEQLLASQESLVGEDDQGEPFYSFGDDGQGADPGAPPTVDQIDAAIQQVTQQPRTDRGGDASQTQAGAIRHAQQLGRLARRAFLENDTDAMSRLEADRAGQGIIGLINEVRESAGRTAGESYARGIQWYQQQQHLYSTNRAEFDRTIGQDPTLLGRYAQWGEVARRLERGEPVLPRPQTSGISSVVTKAYDRIMDLPAAKGLDEASLAMLEPELFADLEPSEAIVQMTETFRSLVGAPARRQAAAPVRERQQQVQSARPPVSQQGAAPARMPISQSGGINVDAIKAAYRRNPADPKARDLYDRYVRPSIYGSEYRPRR